MRNKVTILTLSLIMVLCSSFSVFGASTKVSFDFAEPSISPTQGYFAYTNGSGTPFVLIWSINPKSGDGSTDASVTSSMNMTINSNNIVFTAQTYGGVDATYHITRVSQTGTMSVVASGNMESTVSYTATPTGGVDEFCYAGNIGIVNNNLSGTDRWLRVSWGNDTAINDILDELNDVNSGIGSLVTNTQYLNQLPYMRTELEGINDGITSLSADVLQLKGSLGDIKSELKIIRGEVVDISKQLEQLLEMAGTESVDPLPSENITDLGDLEDSVLSDESEQIGNLELTFGNAFDTVWDLVSQAWQANSKVFTIVIMCLTIGVIKLILNR